MLEDDILNEPIEDQPQFDRLSLLYVFVIAIGMQLLIPLLVEIQLSSSSFKGLQGFLLFTSTAVAPALSASIAVYRFNLKHIQTRKSAPLWVPVVVYGMASLLVLFIELWLNSSRLLLDMFNFGFITKSFVFYLYLLFFQNYFFQKHNFWKWIILLLSFIPATIIQNSGMVFLRTLL